MARFFSVIEQGREEPPNKACTGRLVGPAKKASLGEQFSRFVGWFSQPPVTRAVSPRPRTPYHLNTINRWIVDYNLAQVGDHWKGRLTILARGQHQDLVGGITGFTDRGWLRIEILVVQENHRRSGIGSRLLYAAEDEAQRRGCHSAWLDTFSFQALPFYQQHGYRIFGALSKLQSLGRLFISE